MRCLSRSDCIERCGGNLWPRGDGDSEGLRRNHQRSAGQRVLLGSYSEAGNYVGVVAFTFACERPSVALFFLLKAQYANCLGAGDASFVDLLH